LNGFVCTGTLFRANFEFKAIIHIVPFQFVKTAH